MRLYETLILFSPELSTDNRKEILDNLGQIIANDGGRIAEVDDWGMRELAYPVQKQVRGHYTRLEYVSPGSTVQELERIIRITDGIFKFVTVKLSDEVETEEG